MRTIAIATVAALALALAGCGDEELDPGAERPPVETVNPGVQPGSATVELEEENRSGLEGSARLVRVDTGRTRIEIEAEGSAQAELRPGSCDELGTTASLELEPLRDGVSATVVDASLNELMTGDVALVLLEDGEVAACGEIAPLS